jgi:C4-dicarboxylate-specific signal transduction histidine kinase
MELLPSSSQIGASIDLTNVLDELRVLIEPAYHETGCEIIWRLQDHLPLVVGDHYGLQQVFLNLARNSQRAMEPAEQKRLTVSTDLQRDRVTIRFEDTGMGIASPYELFKPFQPGANSTGLGLYVSSAILRSFGGELKFEPRGRGCCFAVSLATLSNGKESSDG